MAIYNVTFTFVDEQGRSTSRQLLTDQADEAALITEADLMVAVLNGLSKANVSEYTYRRTQVQAGSPGVGSNVDAGMTFKWDSPLAINPTSQIPDPEDAIKDGQGGIDLADLLVTAYTDKYIGVGTWRLNVNNPTQPTAVLSAKLDI